MNQTEQHLALPVTVRRDNGALILEFGERLRAPETALLWPRISDWLAEPETHAGGIRLELGQIRIFDSSTCSS